ncbi:hypothetical protein C8K44_11566 [Aminobacter sp. AP02]|nr:hypothetical protein C8K44_11566 [Aminobacter sp. AP02]
MGKMNWRRANDTRLTQNNSIVTVKTGYGVVQFSVETDKSSQTSLKRVTKSTPPKGRLWLSAQKKEG